MFRHPLSLFRTLAILEAISWTLLIAALIIRAVNPELALAVTIGGGIHGFVFLSYGATVILVALNNRWRAWPTVVGLVSAIVPYATIPTEVWLHRRGSLVGQWRLEQTGDPRRPWVLGILIAAAVVVLYVSLLIIGPPGGKG